MHNDVLYKEWKYSEVQRLQNSVRFTGAGEGIINGNAISVITCRVGKISNVSGLSEA